MGNKASILTGENKKRAMGGDGGEKKGRLLGVWREEAAALNRAAWQ
ncbi:hypothetical protein [Serratia marcescens]|nr:hypothetical protein [Serratia marcescens]